MTLPINNENMVSVIIPFYSDFSWLSDAVDSVILQTYNNFEIIVVNDGSKESDSEFLHNYQDKIIYHRQSNFGPAVARNIGIDLASGDYVAFLDSDDLWLPHKLERQLFYMQENKQVWSHTGYTLFEDSTNKELSIVNPSNFHGSVFFKSLISSPVATPCVMVKRNILISNPTFRFSEDMRYGQDGYMWLSISTKYELGVINEPLTKVRMRGSNASLKVRIYLQVKSQIWDSIKLENQFLDVRNKIPVLVKIAYSFCSKSFRLIRLFENKSKFNSEKIELLSRFFYLPSYVLLKIQKFTSF